MKTNSIRGVVDPLSWAIIILLAAGGVAAYKVIAPGRNTKKADQVAVASTSTASQAAVVDGTAGAVKAAVDASAQAHAETIKVRDAVDHAVAGFLTTQQAILAPDGGDTAQLALQLNHAALDTLGVSLTEAETAKYLQLAAGLVKKNAEQREELARLRAEGMALRASLDATTEHAKAADLQAKTLTATLTDQTTKLRTTAVSAARLAVENKTWADGAESAWDRVKALGWLAVVVALVAVMLGVKFLGAKQTLGDTVALVEHVKGLAVNAGHDAVALEQKVHAWWEGSKNENVVQAIKAKVLRQ